MPRCALPASDARALTAGETALAAAVFGGALDPARVRIRRGKYFFLQPRQVVMAPDGDIWFHPDGGLWRADFAVEPLHLRALLVHELVHVWQHQSGICLPLRRPPFARYAYRLRPGKRFAAYGLEQQARIVEHAYRLTHGGTAPATAADYAALLPFGPDINRHPPSAS